MLGYGGGGLCCVWWGFVKGFEFFFLSLLLRFLVLDLEFFGGPVIMVVICGGGCSGGCCGGGCSSGSWFLVGGDCRGYVFVYSWVLSKYIILMCCIYYFNI